jgi:23S rRNA (uracil1939-C5)-methyltransferase
MISCEFRDNCGACSLWDITYEEELLQKRNGFSVFLEKKGLQSCEIEVLTSGCIEIRDRADMQWRAQQGWGFYSKDKAKVQAIKKCILFSEELQKLYEWFSVLILPVPVASARLRVSPNGDWGIWLDMSNLHIKALLEEQKYLMTLQTKAFVELGQRRKKLTQINSEDHLSIKLKLIDPEFFPWFETYSSKSQPMPLYCTVGSFSQVGFLSNKLLVRAILDCLALSSGDQVLELGSGIGNFTLPLLSSGVDVVAVENDKIALEAFSLNLSTNFKHYLSKINLQKIDFNQVNSEFIRSQLKNPKEARLLVDPPRSGLGRFLNYDFWQDHPFSSIVYVSCSMESWVKDAQVLFAYGYQLKKVTLVDQFPRTDHVESVSFWQ